MSTTLNLVDRLLAMGRKYQELGRVHDARTVLSQLAGFGDLPPDVAEETQVRLAELDMRRRRFVRARRHLTAALVHQPASARYHNLMAAALDTEYKGNPARAAEHYRRSLELDPEQPDCLSAYGALLVGQGEVEAGLEALRRAAEQSPHDPEILGRLVDGLMAANQEDEARQVLWLALFRNGRDGRFRKLWEDFQFRQLHELQQAARDSRDAGVGGGPMVLPFVRPATAPPRRVRRDAASPLPPPHRPRTARLPDQKRAQ
jgi:tetratricopeptide (TPR) repeat protein